MHNLHIFRNQTYKLDKIQPLENGTLVTFINNGLYAMVEQLNNFACYVESRLITLNRQIDTCYANLVILEMKLNSINIPDDQVASQTSAAASSQVETSSVSQNDVVAKANPVSEPTTNDQLETKDDNERGETEGGETPTNEEANTETAQEEHSEELEKYRKMLKLGVHEGAVRQKMLLEGFDPARLKL